MCDEKEMKPDRSIYFEVIPDVIDHLLVSNQSGLDNELAIQREKIGEFSLSSLFLSFYTFVWVEASRL